MKEDKKKNTYSFVFQQFWESNLLSSSISQTHLIVFQNVLVCGDESVACSEGATRGPSHHWVDLIHQLHPFCYCYWVSKERGDRRFSNNTGCTRGKWSDDEMGGCSYIEHGEKKEERRVWVHACSMVIAITFKLLQCCVLLLRAQGCVPCVRMDVAQRCVVLFSPSLVLWYDLPLLLLSQHNMQRRLLNKALLLYINHFLSSLRGTHRSLAHALNSPCVEERYV